MNKFLLSLCILSFTLPCFAQELVEDKQINNTGSYLGYNSIVGQEEVKEGNIKYVIENKKSFLLINRITIKPCDKEQDNK